MSIEVFDGQFPASTWSSAHGDDLIEVALLHDVREWRWHTLAWGMVLELTFADQAAWDRFVASAAYRAAMDAVPDPMSGLLVYRGFGGSNGAGVRRGPRPMRGSGAAALPLPLEDEFLDTLLDRPAPRILAFR